jgi:DNA-binding response OmpR family regulator
MSISRNKATVDPPHIERKETARENGQVISDTILVVDDDEMLLKTIESTLDAEGYTVDVAKTGVAALEKMIQSSYSLVLMDVFLPDMSGLDLLTRVQKLDSDSVKIMMTGHPEIDIAIEALNQGADYFFLKSVEPKKMLKVVKEKLKERRPDSSIGKDEVTVVVPTMNEEEAIGLVLDELKAEGYRKMLVVDGYSKDKTVDIVQKAGVPVVKQHGKDKTGALETAFEHVKTPYLLLMDGDYTYSAKDIERFLPIARKYDQIFGNRREGRHNISRLHRLGNWIINTTLKALFGAPVSDVCTGMYMLKTDAARRLELNSGGFDVEAEVAIQNITHGSVTGVPISYRERLGKRKLSTWRQGFQILWTVVRMSFSYNPLFFLTALGSLFTVPGAMLLLQQFYLRLVHGETGWSVGLVWLGLVFFMLGLNCFTIAIFTLVNKRQERRIVKEIKTILKWRSRATK